MIDSHAHLAHTDYDTDVADTIGRARQAGIHAIVNVGYDLETSARAIEQAEQYPGVYATVGVHPHEASKWNRSTYDRLLRLASHPKVVAVGETGLDFHYDFSPRSCQEETFRSLLHLSLETGLPLVIHNREADEVTLRILEEERKGEVAGVFHCFTSDGDYARRVLDRGLHLGFTGVITYKRSEALRSVVKETPSNRLLIETD
ncbi:MAG: TatD family hydrolase, partial [Armatimonadetes bacterium]|nr:TatD family hydrolase [Armatimonadota bacterium]